MATTNRERVGKALDLLRAGLLPFVEREVRRATKQGRLDQSFERALGKSAGKLDVAGLFKLMTDCWRDVFQPVLGHAGRSLVSELWEHRNRWAHQEAFSSDDTYRALDSAARLLKAVSAPEAGEIESMKMELLRARFDEQTRGARRRQASLPAGGSGAGSLKPWRQVVRPHPDVAAGNYEQAEFAADLWLVRIGEALPEYLDPVEFFRRTYLTESLKEMLVGGVRRLAGKGGEPVIQLQTNFGGGKTHSMLALYHLFSGVPPGDLADVDELVRGVWPEDLGKVRRVVLVGNRISPGNPNVKPDGTEVRTLWGELAWQLGGAEAFARIAKDDERATSPGDVLRQLLVEHGPCLILIDEWVAYARQLHEQSDLPAGSFETQFTFAQALTESVKAAKNCLLVVSLPASDKEGSPRPEADEIEVGGRRGREALERLGNVIRRVESSWRPASAEEGFEIVRRRLFEPFSDQAQYKDRDVVARAFFDCYRGQKIDFPPECSEADYEQRIRRAYPIHPEIFDRLYADWSTLATFQRTRGVLRLMAAVIHSLWEGGDLNPLILPSSLSMEANSRVQSELTRYLPETWAPVIEKDVDGPQSLPLHLDNEVSSLGQAAACRKVARTVFLGSAPGAEATGGSGSAQRGLESRRIKLGCMQPGGAPGIFDDARRRLAEQATYLYQDGTRYWYDTRPTVTKLAEERAAEYQRDRDHMEQAIDAELRDALKETGGFRRIHPAPRSGHDVPDEREVRLVVLDIDHPHHRGPDSPARRKAQEIVESRGPGPRIFRNSLVFMAADRTRLVELEDAACRRLAWQSILDEEETLNLTTHQKKQAEEQLNSVAEAVTLRIPETYQWLLTSHQDRADAPVEWTALQLRGSAPLAVRMYERLLHEGMLAASMAGTTLRLELDRVPLWRGDHVEIAQLVDDFASYAYLHRLHDPSVLLRAVEDGARLLTWERDTFAYADSYDEDAGRYRGLRGGEMIPSLDASAAGVLVKPEAARRQMDAEKPPSPAEALAPGADGASAGDAARASGGQDAAEGTTAEPAAAPRPRRYHGSVTLNATRVGLDASQIAEEVVAHLAGIVGAEVKVTLEIDASIPPDIGPGSAPAGFSEEIVRAVTENSRTLRFDSHGFERE